MNVFNIYKKISIWYSFTSYTSNIQFFDSIFCPLSQSLFQYTTKLVHFSFPSPTCVSEFLSELFYRITFSNSILFFDQIFFFEQKNFHPDNNHFFYSNIIMCNNTIDNKMIINTITQCFNSIYFTYKFC